MKKTTVVSVISTLICMASIAAQTPNKWLVIEDTPTGTSREYADFPRLLLMQISKAGVFRCVDRATYRTQSKEVALGDDGDVEFKSAGYCISWVIRPRETARGLILTVSIGYNNIGRSGNNELIRSEDVVVRERSLKGEDMLTAAAKKSARAILFSLTPPQVVDVTTSKSGKKLATVDYGKEFLSVGENVYILRKKESKNGKSISKKVGLAVVKSADLDSSTVQISKGDVAEDDYLLTIDEDQEASKSGLCPVCDGKKKYKIDVKCDGCNGQGKLWHIRGRSRNLKPCQECGGKGTRSMEKICEECSGSGKVN